MENGTVKQDFLEDILRQINDVTAEDVMRVAQKYIKPSQFRIVTTAMRARWCRLWSWPGTM